MAALYDKLDEEQDDDQSQTVATNPSMSSEPCVEQGAADVDDSATPEELTEEDFEFVDPICEQGQEDHESFVIGEKPVEAPSDAQSEAEFDPGEEEDLLDPDFADQDRRNGRGESSQGSLIARIKDNPVMALPLVGGVVLLLFSLSSFLSFGAEQEPKASVELSEQDLALIEEPKGIESLTEQEIARRMAEQERKSRQKKEQERLIADQERRRIYEAEAAKRQARAEASSLGAGRPAAAVAGYESDAERIRRLEQELAMLKAGRALNKHRRKSSSRRHSKKSLKQKPAAAPESPADAQRDNVPVEQSKIPVKSAGFYRAGVTIERPGQGEDEKGAAKSIPAGTVIRAKLKMGVRTDTRSEVLATVVEAVRGSDGQVAIPAGAVLHGRARAEKRRVLLDFSQASFSGSRVALRGYAVWQKMPGLVGKVIRKARRAGGARDTILERGAKSTVRGLVNRIPGSSVAGDLARNVAGEGVSDLGDSYSNGFSSADAVLELKAGKAFEIVVTGD